MTLVSSNSGRRILLIAYEYPPSPSPQSLRWSYLSRELSRLGHEVHVLTIDLGGQTHGLPELPDDIKIHRTYPGPFRGYIASRRKRHEAQTKRPTGTAAAALRTAQKPSRAGWKHRVSLLAQRTFEHFIFPDIRGEWYMPARRQLKRLLTELRPDLVISSHEPATTLQLGVLAKEAGFPWIADLGDPVLAPYTPWRWRHKARRLEKQVCRLADHVLVTAQSAKDLLQLRHGVRSPISVLTQGFDDQRPVAVENHEVHERLELLYTGSLYRFRRIDALIDAVIKTTELRLNIASIAVPDFVREASRAHPEQIRLLGFLPHEDAIAWQSRADVLVNLANADPMQVPGKCYEYLGSGRPLLHLGDNLNDAAARLIIERRRGWLCPQRPDALAEMLSKLVALHKQGKLGDGLSLDREGVMEFGWSTLGKRLAEIIDRISSQQDEKTPAVRDCSTHEHTKNYPIRGKWHSR